MWSPRNKCVIVLCRGVWNPRNKWYFEGFKLDQKITVDGFNRMVREMQELLWSQRSINSDPLIDRSLLLFGLNHLMAGKIKYRCY